MKPRRSPQEKKALSYAKDRRENYGQNDKASRRLVPLRKAQANRRLRHKDKQALIDIDLAAESLGLARMKPDWRKWSGESLRCNVDGKLRDRALLEGTPHPTQTGRRRLHLLKHPEIAARLLRAGLLDRLALLPVEPKKEDKE